MVSDAEITQFCVLKLHGLGAEITQFWVLKLHDFGCRFYLIS